MVRSLGIFQHRRCILCNVLTSLDLKAVLVRAKRLRSDTSGALDSLMALFARSCSQDHYESSTCWLARERWCFPGISRLVATVLLSLSAALLQRPEKESRAGSTASQPVASPVPSCAADHAGAMVTFGPSCAKLASDGACNAPLRRSIA